LSGRFFTSQDRLDRANVVIINRKLAEQFFPGESPLGKHIRVSLGARPQIYEIVGVVGDTLDKIGQPVHATFYFPVLFGAPDWTSDVALVVRSSVNPLSLSVPIQKQIAAIDSAQPVYDVRTMQEIIGRATASQNFTATMVLAFAALSLLLAAVGLYGVLSYLVSQRSSEIGIRMALGAQRTEVLRLVLLDGLRPVIVGLVIGSAGAIAAGMLIRSILYSTRPIDPLVFAAMVGTLLVTAAIASAVPALRACRIEPSQALRTE
jgi:ABC-type antimicrobial peptide transport system permease subunit